jgi:hypothetical protein
VGCPGDSEHHWWPSAIFLLSVQIIVYVVVFFAQGAPIQGREDKLEIAIEIMAHMKWVVPVTVSIIGVLYLLTIIFKYE